jgi:hypothetical protein
MKKLKFRIGILLVMFRPSKGLFWILRDWLSIRVAYRQIKRGGPVES